MACEGERNVLDVSSAPTVPKAYVLETLTKEAIGTGATQGVEEMNQGSLVSWCVLSLAVPCPVLASGRRRRGLSYSRILSHLGGLGESILALALFGY